MSDQHSQVFYRKHKRIKPTISYGEGVYLYDTEGKQYIDAAGGAIVVNVGHGVREIAGAIGQQAAQVAYAHATMFNNAPLEELAERLAAYLPFEDGRLFFMATGSEATEAAMKVARQIQIARGETSRYKIISRWGSYHGATLGALAIMGKPSMRKHFEPMFLDMPKIAPPYCYRCPFGLNYPDCGLHCAESLELEIKRQGAGTVAAFIAEPISGATLGAVVPPEGYWLRIREICDQYGVLLIADEVMTGMGRTGTWFAMEGVGVSPDILCLGKGLSGGYVPLSATAARGDWVELLWEKSGDFNHGGTYSHQPVAAAAGVATLDYMETHDLVGRAAQLGERLGQKLHAAFDDHPQVGDVRGRGMLWGVELVTDREGKQPYPPSAHVGEMVFQRAFAEGLIIYAGSGSVDGVRGDHVTIGPPFVINEAQIDEIIERLKVAIRAVVDNLKVV